MNKKSKTIFNPKYKDLVAGIVDVRHKKNLSQVELAKLMGVSKTYIARTEIRDRRLDVLETVDLLKAMGLSKSEIMKVIEKLI